MFFFKRQDIYIEYFDRISLAFHSSFSRVKPVLFTLEIIEF